MERVEMIRRRFFSQRLAGRRFESPEEVVSWLGAMQGQEYAEAKWSVAERTTGRTEADIEGAFDAGRILRTHMLRPTWHVVTPADIRSFLRLTAPRVHQASAYMYRQLELDRPTFAKSTRLIEKALVDGPLSRPQIAARLNAAGLEAVSLRLGYLMMYAELEGVICSGPRSGKQHTYALLENRVPDLGRWDRDQALAALAGRFFASRGPVTVHDFAYWSGLTVADARHGLEMVRSGLEHTVDDDGVEWLESPHGDIDGGARNAYLIPTYDETIMSYKDVKVVMSNPPIDRAMLKRPVVVEGVTVGSWRRKLAGEGVTVEVLTFGSLPRGNLLAVTAAADRFGRFLGLPVSVDTSMIGV